MLGLLVVFVFFRAEFFAEELVQGGFTVRVVGEFFAEFNKDVGLLLRCIKLPFGCDVLL